MVKSIRQQNLQQKQSCTEIFVEMIVLCCFTILLLLLSSASTVEAVSSSSSPEPLFLFAGESNMNGHSSDGSSLTGDSTIQDYIFNKWLSDPKEAHLSARLKLAFKDVDVTTTTTTMIPEFDIEVEKLDEIAQHEAKLLSGLYENDILPTSIQEFHSAGKCFHIDPSDTVIGQSATVPIGPNVNCGSSYGYELSFAYSLGWTSPFTIAKVAAGHTQLYKHWMPPNGMYWNDLKSTIHSTAGGNWQGFVWHQGESDCLVSSSYGGGENNDGDGDGGEDTSLTYADNLTEFMKHVRQEMYDAAAASPSSGKKWTKPSDIPIAIIEIGAWPPPSSSDVNPYKHRIKLAQQEFCENDDNAVLVRIDDLCPFENLDAVALLIVGKRLQKAFGHLLTEEVHETTTTDQSTTISTESPTNTLTTSKATEEPTLTTTSSPTQHPTHRPTHHPKTPRPTSNPTTSTVIDTSSPTESSTTVSTPEKTEEEVDNDEEEREKEEEEEEAIEKEEEMEEREKRIFEDSALVLLIGMIVVGINVLCGGAWAFRKCQRKITARTMFQYQNGLHSNNKMGHVVSSSRQRGSSLDSDDVFNDEETSGLVTTRAWKDPLAQT